MKEKIITNFYDNKKSKEGSPCICLSVILIDSVFRTGKSYCPHIYSEEYKCIGKEKKMAKYITDNVEVSCGEENCDEENSNNENSDNENSNEKIYSKE